MLSEADRAQCVASLYRDSAEFLAAVEAAVPTDEPGVRPREIRRRLGLFSAAVVRLGLKWLVEDGRVTFTGEPRRRLYRRVAAAEA
jgi:hypothetical protein